MAKVEAVEIRPGNLIEWDKRVWRVLKSYHVHVGGRGGAFMQVEMKDIEAGTKTNCRRCWCARGRIRWGFARRQDQRWRRT